MYSNIIHNNQSSTNKKDLIFEQLKKSNLISKEISIKDYTISSLDNTSKQNYQSSLSKPVINNNNNNIIHSFGMTMIDNKLKLLGEFNKDIEEKIRLLRQKLKSSPLEKGTFSKFVNLKNRLFEKIVLYLSNTDLLSIVNSNEKAKMKLIDICILKGRSIVNMFSSKYKKYFLVDEVKIVLKRYVKAGSSSLNETIDEEMKNNNLNESIKYTSKCIYLYMYI